MILSGLEIEKRMAAGDIFIRPFDRNRLNPNSYNLTLHNELIVYDEPILDMAKDNKYHTITIPPEGLVLEPGKLYLGRTAEFTETHNLVPMLEGRSSIGRLGIYIHVTAGFGDVGFEGFWTLEIQCVQPVRIYPFVEIGQVYYHTIEGEYESYSKKGKYQGNTGIQTSQIWREFGDGKPSRLVRDINPEDLYILQKTSPGACWFQYKTSDPYSVYQSIYDFNLFVNEYSDYEIEDFRMDYNHDNKCFNYYFDLKEPENESVK